MERNNNDLACQICKPYPGKVIPTNDMKHCAKCGRKLVEDQIDMSNNLRVNIMRAINSCPPIKAQCNYIKVSDLKNIDKAKPKIRILIDRDILINNINKLI